MSTKRPSSESNDSTTTPDSPLVPEVGASKTARTIREALRNKAHSEASRRGGIGLGDDQKPPKPPHGTRRSMGKR